MKSMKVGFFGTGLMATIYADIFKRRGDVELVAAVGNTPEKTKAFAEKHGLKGYADSAYELMLKEHPQIDAVVIATPEWVREAPIQAATQAGKHVLLEKPFALNVADGLKFAEAFRRSGKIFDICHVLRYSPRFRALKQSVEQGQIGEVRQIYARRNSNNQRVKRVLGKTDLAFWLTPHDVDLMRWVTRSDVEEVYAVSRNGLKSADDYLTIHLKFANCVTAVEEISWCTPPLSGVAREALFEVRGTGGAIELEDFNMNVKVFSGDGRVSAPDTYESYEIQGRGRGIFEYLADAFADRVIAGEKGGSEEALQDALETTRVCSMVRKSIDERRIVKRSEL